MRNEDVEWIIQEFNDFGVNEWIRLAGIRGYFDDDAKNIIGAYDDLIIRCIGKDITGWRASTDPGKYWINHPVNPSGCAQLQCGLWRFAFGLHKGKSALVQAEDFIVNRLDTHGEIECTEKGRFGINLHSGGYEDDVGRWSAGCQIIQCPEGSWGKTWLDFYEPLYDSGHKQFGGIPYLLIDAKKKV